MNRKGLRTRRNSSFKRVPAVDKCFAILDFITSSRQPIGITEISNQLHLSKSTVFSIVLTLADLNVLEHRADTKLTVGTRLYILGKAAGEKAELIRTVHPYLKDLSQESMISSFLAVRWGTHAVIVDKVEAEADVKLSYEIGTRLPLLEGAPGKALLCRIPDEEFGSLLNREGFPTVASNNSPDVIRLKKLVAIVREDGIVYDMEEHIKGVIAVAAPIVTHRADIQAAIFVAGLKNQWREGRIFSVAGHLKEIADGLVCRFAAV